jgi:lysophospholipase L1-like esterase
MRIKRLLLVVVFLLISVQVYAGSMGWIRSVQLTDTEFAENAYSTILKGTDNQQYIRTSNGARLVYSTTATNASIETYNNIYPYYPQFTKIGVRVDGADYATVTPGKVGRVVTSLDLPAGAKTVEFINGLQTKPGDLFGTYITNLYFNASITKITPTSTPKIIVYGDSIAVGGNTTNPALEGWVQLVRNAYSGAVQYEAWGCRTLSADASTEAKRTTFASLLASQNPTIIWLAIGTNDYYFNSWTAENFGIAYADLLDKIHAALPNAVIYAQTLLLRNSETANAGGNTPDDYRAAIATAQSTRSDYCTLVNGKTILEASDLADGIHPTTAGHAKYATAVRAVLGF